MTISPEKRGWEVNRAGGLGRSGHLCHLWAGPALLWCCKLNEVTAVNRGHRFRNHQSTNTWPPLSCAFPFELLCHQGWGDQLEPSQTKRGAWASPCLLQPHLHPLGLHAALSAVWLGHWGTKMAREATPSPLALSPAGTLAWKRIALLGVCGGRRQLFWKLEQLPSIPRPHLPWGVIPKVLIEISLPEKWELRGAEYGLPPGFHLMIS